MDDTDREDFVDGHEEDVWIINEEARRVANRIADSLDADVILYNGPIGRPYDTQFIEACTRRRRRENVYLIIVTEGGDLHAAYRIARYLQERYTGFIMYISGPCASAGTLMAVGAHELVMHDQGELGPIDAQIPISGEPEGMRSSLTVSDALDALQTMALSSYRSFLRGIQDSREEEGDEPILMRTAMEVAAKMTTDLFSPIYGQVDPMHVGDARRAMLTSERYGTILLREGLNISEEGLFLLASDYPSHGFVIDRAEAQRFFYNVDEPDADELRLASELGELALEQQDISGSRLFEFLSNEVPEE